MKFSEPLYVVAKSLLEKNGETLFYEEGGSELAFKVLDVASFTFDVVSL